MITPILITKARLKLGELTNKVFRKENVYILSKSGLPVAATINMEEFNKLGLIRLDQLNSLVKDLGRLAEKKAVTEKKLEGIMEETKEKVFMKI